MKKNNLKVGDRAQVTDDKLGLFGEKGTVAGISNNLITVRFDKECYISTHFHYYSLTRLVPKKAKEVTPPELFTIFYNLNGRVTIMPGDERLEVRGNDLECMVVQLIERVK